MLFESYLLHSGRGEPLWINFNKFVQSAALSLAAQTERGQASRLSQEHL